MATVSPGQLVAPLKKKRRKKTPDFQGQKIKVGQLMLLPLSLFFFHSVRQAARLASWAYQNNLFSHLSLERSRFAT